jgi:hypothetical protein
MALLTADFLPFTWKLFCQGHGKSCHDIFDQNPLLPALGTVFANSRCGSSVIAFVFSSPAPKGDSRHDPSW